MADAIRLGVTLLLVAAGARAAADEPAWEPRGIQEGVAISTRSRPGSPVLEVRGETILRSTPASIWAVIQDVQAYPKIMPYTREAKVLGAEGKSLDLYVHLAPPFVRDRDYAVRRTIEHLPSDGSGMYRLSWHALGARPGLPPPCPHCLRLTSVSGYYELTPEQGGAATHVVYVVQTDPGGRLPAFLVDGASRDAVPRVLRVLRDWSRRAPYVDAR